MWSVLSVVCQFDCQGCDDVEVVVFVLQFELCICLCFYEFDVQCMVVLLGELFVVVGVCFVQGSVQCIDVVGKWVEYCDVEGMLG